MLTEAAQDSERAMVALKRVRDKLIGSEERSYCCLSFSRLMTSSRSGAPYVSRLNAKDSLGLDRNANESMA
jgi:hypothetical protein